MSLRGDRADFLQEDGQKVKEAEGLKNLKIETMVLGPCATNCYLVTSVKTAKLLIVDPSAHADRIQEKIQRMNGVPEAILLTHGHFDHIGAVESLRKTFSIPVYACKDEEEVLSSIDWNLSEMFGSPMTLKADHLVSDGEHVSLLGEDFAVLHTPGHTKGSCCYYCKEEDLLLSGDTLFCESVGRSDFPTGSMSALARSVREKLFVLPEETFVYPGHDSPTSIGHEKRYNPFV